ncbi:MAG TPA: S8 family serine peptidase, partial [Gemmataceae bacterium]|nr:S8 family serine peptidase [Gemmataceae bacterium]
WGETLVPGIADLGLASRHGTHVASVIFGRHDGLVPGVAPRCRGILLPIFRSLGEQSFQPCSQLDLARAITQAVQQGAHVVNISGGQFSPSGTAHPLLADVVRDCARRGVLIVAAAGNDGCACLHIPAALDSVLAVGAMDARGEPLDSSNWGGPYGIQGILAPGVDILGAQPGGGTARATGTSYATALISGVAALLVSLQRKRGRPPSPLLVREALLRSAIGCDQQPTTDCRRLLAGRLNVNGAVSILVRSMPAMSDSPTAPIDSAPNQNQPAAATPTPLAPSGDAVRPAAVQPSACGCQTGAPQLVYALGQLSYDLVSEARLDGLAQTIAGVAGASAPERVLAFDRRRMLAHLDAHPWDSAAVEWTLSLDGTAIYAVRPQGPFAADVYKQLRRFLREQLDEGVERVSIPGVVAGKATLLLGQVVPVVVPELRGMFSWTTAALTDAVAGAAPAEGAPQQERDAHAQCKAGVRNFLDRVYHGLRNLGLMPQDRAINFAATNAFAFEKIYEVALKEKMELESVNVVRSPICRPGSDCWDVEVYFFYPERQVQTVRRVYRFTVDVSDIVPVTVGPTRSWFTR